MHDCAQGIFDEEFHLVALPGHVCDSHERVGEPENTLSLHVEIFLSDALLGVP
jgi:hypothetical protein